MEDYDTTVVPISVAISVLADTCSIGGISFLVNSTSLPIMAN